MLHDTWRWDSFQSAALRLEEDAQRLQPYAEAMIRALRKRMVMMELWRGNGAMDEKENGAAEEREERRAQDEDRDGARLRASPRGRLRKVLKM